MTLQTRKPTGKASYPLILLAGGEGSGKTWAAVEATGMPTVDRAFFLEIGEGMADEYGAVPGADFEIIEHDGTIGAIREVIQEVTRIPAEEGKHNLLIVDSMSELWSLLSDNAQREANARAKRKGRNIGDGAKIDMDLWNRATDVWEGIVRQLHQFPGPVIMTARMEIVTVMDGEGRPTKQKDFKIQTQKRLPYRVTAVLEARQHRVWTMTKIATTVPSLQLPPGKQITFEDFSVAKLLDTMGVTAGMAESTFQKATPDDALSDEAQDRAEQVEQAAREQARREKQQAQRQAFVKSFTDDLLAAESAGDLNAINALGKQAQDAGDGELVRIAMKIRSRLQAAQQAAPPVVDGEVMPDGSDTA